MQAITKGLEKVNQELAASESDGPVSEVFRKVFFCVFVYWFFIIITNHLVRDHETNGIVHHHNSNGPRVWRVYTRRGKKGNVWLVLLEGLS